MNRFMYGLILIVALSGCTQVDIVARQSSKEYVEGVLTPTYTFNGTSPGPTLKATVGELFELTVKNTLPEPMTIHWHGVRLPNEMDGVPDVTQKPILPGNTFTYAFTPLDAGVYWYHSHVDTHKQVEMGMQGVFIVDDSTIKIPNDTKHILVLDDVAINEDGTYRSFDLNYMHGRFGNIIVVNGERDPVITSYGVNHRFQIVNTANARSFTLSFGNNPITVYGTDIGYDQPYTTQTLTVHPGERFDIVVRANSSFGISQLSRQSIQIAKIEVQTLQYSADATQQLPINEVFIPQEIYNQYPDMELSLQGVRDPEHGLVWQINGTDSLTNPGTFTLEQGFTKLRLYNTQGQPHPMHLHGQQFIVLERNGIQQEQLTWKDTVMVGSRETVDLVVYAEEPGNWVFHCHILEHARAGMLVTMEVEV